MLLGAHPDACTVGQIGADTLDDPVRYRCSCGAPIRKCAFWNQVKSVMEKKGMDFDVANPVANIHATKDAYTSRLLAPLHRGPALEGLRDLALLLSSGWRAHRNFTQLRYAKLVETLSEIAGAEVIVDSSKTGVRLKYLLRHTGLEIRVIWLVRDGRGVGLTYVDPLSFADASKPELRAGGFGGGRKLEQKSWADATREWRRSNEEAECVVATMEKSQWTQVRYEQLCANPKDTLQSICFFLGLDPAKVNLDFRSRPQHVIGNGMRLDSSSQIKLDERWKSHLTADDLAVFDRVAGKLNREYGYV
jgi:hypothetical protein